jgi:VWFA-related protein
MLATRPLLVLSILWPIMLAQEAQRDAQRDTQADRQEVRIQSGPYSPQKPAPQSATIVVQANLVELGVTVRNRDGQPAGGFKAADFELADGGKPQTITFFAEQRAPHAQAASLAAPRPAELPPAGTAAAQETRAPRYIALFFDDTHTEGMTLQKGRDAAKKFLTEGVEPGDYVAIFTGSGSPVADFTADAKSLLDVLDKLKPHTELYARGIGSCPVLNPWQAYAIDQRIDLSVKQAALNEAVQCFCGLDAKPECIGTQEGRVQSAAAMARSIFMPQSASVLDRLDFAIRRLSVAPGGRVLILISPGFVTGGLDRQISGLMDAALRASIVINSLDSVGLSTNPTRGMERLVMSELMATASIATGGQFIQNSNDLSGELHGLAEPAKVSYVLGFSPAGEPDEKYHALKVKLKDGSGYRVEARPGYFSTKLTNGVTEKPSDQPAEPIQQWIDRLAASREARGGLPSSVHASQAEKDGRAVIQVDISVDAKGLKFVERGDRHVQQLTFVTMVLDSAGNFIEGKQSVMDLAVTRATLAGLQSKGIGVSTSFSLPKGSYQVREVIREAVENHLTASNSPIKVE